MWTVYFTQSLKDKTFYIGCSENVILRIKRHNKGYIKSTKSKKPWKLVYKEEYNSKHEAFRREKELKQNYSEKKKVLQKIKERCQSGRMGQS